MKTLNNGYVELIEWMGGDNAVIRNARRCWKSESKGEESDRKLIKHLLAKGHMTPFEAMVFTFDIKCPLFVARQWHRHRIGSYNEESLRYCIAEKDFYVPDNLTNGQKKVWIEDHEMQFKNYAFWIGHQKVPKEQARAILPTGIYTKFYWTVNGSSLMNFLRLRTDKHAQAEIREYAQNVLCLVQRMHVAPITFYAFEQHLTGGAE